MQDEQLKTETENGSKAGPKILEDVSQLREGQRLHIGKVILKIQRIRPDKTIVVKPIGKLP